MTVNSSTGAALLRPEDVGPLLIQPTQDQSVAMQVATVVRTVSRTYRIPVVVTDPNAAWVNEGEEIALSDPSLAELKITPAKIAGISVISRELANDSSPAADDEIGRGLSRDLAKKIDLAFFGPALPAPAPSGLPALSGVGTVDGDYTDVDWAAAAISQAQVVGATLTSFVASPATALKLANIKSGTNFNTPLLGLDPTVPTRRTVQGVPILVSPYVADDVVWGIPSDRVTAVIREDAEIAQSTEALFTSDRVAIRAIMRVSWGFPHAAAVQKVTLLTA